MWGTARPGRLEGAGTPFQWDQAIGHSRQPFANVLGGPWQLVAGPAGLTLGIFGWADPATGEVSNLYAAGAQLGFVLPVRQMYNWQRVYPNWIPPVPPPLPYAFVPPLLRGLVLRPGCECVLAAMGDFITCFPLGGSIGNRVWADPSTGIPYAAPAGQNLATQGGLVITTQGGEPLSTDSGGFVPTPWVVMQNGGCNAKLRISSFVQPVN